MKSILIGPNNQKVDLTNTYAGGGMFLLGGGPSLREAPLHLLKTPGCLVMAMNNAAALFRPHLWTSLDSPRNFLLSVWQDPAIMKFSPSSRASVCPYDSELKCDHFIRTGNMPNAWFFRSNTTFQPDKYLEEDSVNYGNSEQRGGGRSVMLASIKLAYYLGIRRIYLMGVDFHMTPEDTYAFKQAKDKKACEANNKSYVKLIQYFTELKPYFEEAGLQIYMCNPASKLDLFPLLTVEQAVDYETSTFIAPQCEDTDGLYTTRKTGTTKKSMGQDTAHVNTRVTNGSDGRKITTTQTKKPGRTKGPERRWVDPAFFKQDMPNPYPEHEALRQEYFKELEKLGGAECPGCQLGALRRKFASRLV